LPFLTGWFFATSHSLSVVPTLIERALPWSRMREVTEPQAQQIESALQTDIEAGRYRLLSLPAGVFDQARRWLSSRDTSLRALDALHLASAAQQQCCLLTADQQLATPANTFGVQCQMLHEY